VTSAVCGLTAEIALAPRLLAELAAALVIIAAARTGRAIARRGLAGWGSCRAI
jgi:hypothetical protein